LLFSGLLLLSFFLFILFAFHIVVLPDTKP
jgi:hypothetical protein